ncbi:iron-sulfur cluster assembly 1 homolog, mitochondrial [Synchiropus splendidus]|uniref:iron-sulfur cluster assembly 1 homolog, mitochondrial n=1 Tax=Synchiropus splendidus TaxID=270530 RepID=UPI00237EC69F|nr:iron-sulfur cluster assembly 1 homolog, mitochondrial [Synchiropus splendidus]
MAIKRFAAVIGQEWHNGRFPVLFHAHAWASLFSTVSNMSASMVRATVRAVSKRKILATRAALTLTPAAVNKIRTLLQNKPEYIGLKVGVRTRGCNGLTYTLDYTKEKDKSDEEVVQDGVRVFIEKKAQLTLLGTEMDFVESMLSSEFVFNNPNIKGTCGCGESFNI